MRDMPVATRVYVGGNVGDQPVFSNEYVSKVCESHMYTNKLDGTIQLGRGVYQGKSEGSVCVTLIDQSWDDIIKFIDGVKKALRQETVLVTYSTVRGELR